jgi:RNA polymerase-binding transcription factor DksA
MDQTFIARVKAQLMEEKARLERDLAELGYSMNERGEETLIYPESGGNSSDDNAQEVTTLADDMSIVQKLSKDLKDTYKALDSIEKGEYGICKYCKKEIDEKRLLARPTSSSCIECKKTLTQEL